MAAQGKALAAMCAEQGLGSDHILVQLPGTFAGIQAAEALQASSIDCEIIGVYSLPQAALAVDKGAAVMVINLRHINLWYDSNPGAIRDPHVRPRVPITTSHGPPARVAVAKRRHAWQPQPHAPCSCHMGARSPQTSINSPQSCAARIRNQPGFARMRAHRIAR